MVTFGPHDLLFLLSMVASRTSTMVGGMSMNVFSRCCGMVWAPSVRGPGAAQSVPARSIGNLFHLEEALHVTFVD